MEACPPAGIFTLLQVRNPEGFAQALAAE